MYSTIYKRPENVFVTYSLKKTIKEQNLKRLHAWMESPVLEIEK